MIPDKKMIHKKVLVNEADSKESKMKTISRIPPHFIYAAVIFVIGMSFVGGYLYFHYQDVKMKKLEQEKREAAIRTNTALLENCLTEAEDIYWNYWKTFGTKTNKGYSLPSHQANEVQQVRLHAREECIKRYPVQ